MFSDVLSKYAGGASLDTAGPEYQNMLANFSSGVKSGWDKVAPLQHNTTRVNFMLVGLQRQQNEKRKSHANPSDHLLKDNKVALQLLMLLLCPTTHVLV